MSPHLQPKQMTSPWKIFTHVSFTSEPLANVEYITPYKFNDRGKGHGHGGPLSINKWLNASITLDLPTITN